MRPFLALIMQLRNGKERKTFANQSLNTKGVYCVLVSIALIYSTSRYSVFVLELDFYQLQNLYPYTSNTNNKLIILSMLTMEIYYDIDVDIDSLVTNQNFKTFMRLLTPPSYLFISYLFINN